MAWLEQSWLIESTTCWIYVADAARTNIDQLRTVNGSSPNITFILCVGLAQVYWTWFLSCSPCLESKACDNVSRFRVVSWQEVQVWFVWTKVFGIVWWWWWLATAKLDQCSLTAPNRLASWLLGALAWFWLGTELDTSIWLALCLHSGWLNHLESTRNCERGTLKPKRASVQGSKFNLYICARSDAEMNSKLELDSRNLEKSSFLWKKTKKRS